MLRGRISGQITLFSAIIMLAVLILAGLLVDISRINTGKAMVKRAADSAARSLLADYGSKLKEDYGIFAIPDSTGLQDKFEEYLAFNLSIPDEEDFYEGSTDLFGYRIERISVTPIYNLSENDVTKKQILEYMKYRAPSELVEGFLEKLTAIEDIGKMSNAYKQKIGIDKILGKMDKSQQKLKKLVDGTGNSINKYINGFNLNGSWENAYQSFNSLTADLSSMKNSIESMNSSMSGLETQKSQLEKDIVELQKNEKNKESANETKTEEENDGENEDSIDSGVSELNQQLSELESQLDSLKNERSDMQEKCNGTESQLNQLWNDIRHSMTGDFLKSNEDSVREIEKIAEKGRKAQESIFELEKYLRDNFGKDKGTFSKDFGEQAQKELESLKALVLDGKKAEEMINDVISNSTLLKDVAARMDQTGQSSGSIRAPLPPELPGLIKQYTKIAYQYTKPPKGDTKEDPREGKADAVKKFIIEEIFEDVNYITEGIDKTELPSFTKVHTVSFDQQDEEFAGEQNKDGISGSSIDTEASYDGNLQNIGQDMDLYDEDGMFQENALGFISDIGELVAAQAIDLRDNIYLNEYIMGTFKNSVPVIKYGNKSIKDTNLHGMDKETLKTFYSNEVEYILHGQPSQKLNNIMTKGELLLIRFGMNTLHVYTDAKKKTMATSVATAVAGWWTGGAGIPILSNLMMCGWGMGEAIIDVSDLMEGKSVPIYKMKGDWHLDIGLPVESVPKTDSRLYFNYHDYLRLFLLTMNENKKLDRIEDLIQLNIGKEKSGFKMSGSHTYVRIEAEISMKYLFITQPFVKKEIKTGDGRYIYKVLVYEGY